MQGNEWVVRALIRQIREGVQGFRLFGAHLRKSGLISGVGVIALLGIQRF